MSSFHPTDQKLGRRLKTLEEESDTSCREGEEEEDETRNSK